MAEFKTGDRVMLATREVTADDEKSGLYYSYFGGLTGSVDRVYDDGTVCVDVDIESLSEDARERHLAMQEAEKKRWLDGLSGEARNRLTPEQKQLKLSYKILTSNKDLTPIKGDKPKGGKQAEAAASNEDTSASDLKGPARAPEPKQAPSSSSSARRASASDEEPTPKRVSEADLSKAEEEYLRKLQERAAQK